MTHEQKHTRLRELLAKWYAGSATREEEWEISLQLSSGSALPPDIEADARLFFAFSEAAAEPVTMPAIFSARIEKALAQEIAQAEPAELHVDISRNRRNRWLYWSAAACVALIVCGLGLHWLVQEPDVPHNPAPQQAVAVAALPIALPPSAVVTAPSSSSLPIRTENTASSSHRSPVPPSSPSSRLSVPPSSPSSELPVEELPELLPEEKALAASNYRVVYDTREAEEILASVFSRLERNLELESMRLARIEIEHESELARLASIETTAVLLDCYDSQRQTLLSQPTSSNPTSPDKTNPI